MKKTLLRSAIVVFILSGCNDSASNRIKDSVLKIEHSSKNISIDNDYLVKVVHEDFAIDSLKVSGAAIKEFNTQTRELKINFPTVGNKKIEILAFSGEEERKVTFTLGVFPKTAPVQMEYEIVKVLEHDPNSYTQGFEIYNDRLYESKGQYGASAVRILEKEKNKLVHEAPLPNQFFGEGLSILRDTVYQLTWKARKCYVYDADLNFIRFETIPTAEGWGLCNDGKDLFLSDGSHVLYRSDSKLRIKQGIEVYAGKFPLKNLNELEYVEGKIYANIYNSDNIFCIDPKTGTAESFIDLSALRLQLNNPGAEVLNGIAYLTDQQQFMITGKYWDKTFIIKIKP